MALHTDIVFVTKINIKKRTKVTVEHYVFFKCQRNLNLVYKCHISIYLLTYSLNYECVNIPLGGPVVEAIICCVELMPLVVPESSNRGSESQSRPENCLLAITMAVLAGFTILICSSKRR